MKVYYTDGASKHNGNSGKQKAYICVVDEEENVIADRFIGNHTNIEAEGFALITCFEHIYKNNIREAVIKTDSKFWIDAIKGHWKLKKPHLFPIRDRLYNGWNYFNINDYKISLEWVPREESKAGWHLEKQYKTKAQQRANTPELTPIVK